MPCARRKLLDAIDPQVWQQTWVVDVEAVGDGRATLKYLAPYVYRAAISNNRIESVDESSVTYRVTPTRTREPNALASGIAAEEPVASANGSRPTRTRQVSGNEFMRGFLQHTLTAQLPATALLRLRQFQ